MSGPHVVGAGFAGHQAARRLVLGHVDGIDLRRQGRLVVNEDLTVPGHPEIVACGDGAAVPT